MLEIHFFIFVLKHNLWSVTGIQRTHMKSAYFSIFNIACKNRKQLSSNPPSRPPTNLQIIIGMLQMKWNWRLSLKMNAISSESVVTAARESIDVASSVPWSLGLENPNYLDCYIRSESVTLSSSVGTNYCLIHPVNLFYAHMHNVFNRCECILWVSCPSTTLLYEDLL